MFEVNTFDTLEFLNLDKQFKKLTIDNFTTTIAR